MVRSRRSVGLNGVEGRGLANEESKKVSPGRGLCGDGGSDLGRRRGLIGSHGGLKSWWVQWCSRGCVSAPRRAKLRARYGNSHSDGDGHPHTHCDDDRDAHTYSNDDRDAHTYSDQDTYSLAYSNDDHDVHTYSDQDSDPYSDVRECESQPNTDFDALSYAY